MGETCLRPLDYIIRFPTKLIAKLCFGNFRIFLKFCSLFKIFAPKMPPKKSSQVFEKGVSSNKFTFVVWNTCLGLWQNCYLSFLCHIYEYFWGTVPLLWCFLPKGHQNYHRFLKWVWHLLDLLASFKVCNKISNSVF